MLRLVVPKGSLERQTLDLFAAADLAILRSSDVDYRGSIDDERVADVRVLRPQEIPLYVSSGLFDIGITGRDWVQETRADVVSLGELRYSKATDRPVMIVIAVHESSPTRRVEDLHRGARVATEYPDITRRFLAERGVEAEVLASYGATEAKVPEIADAIVEVTETGRALEAAGLRVLEVVLESYPELIANRQSCADADKARAMAQILTLLQGALDARGKVLVKLNVSARDLDAVLKLLPSMKAPTVSQLSGDSGFAIETVIKRTEINVLLPALKEAGATDILELALSKIVH
ncbi:MAG: ATP phosphoribosyltransferase [Acidimicrobiales bacterium]